MATPGTSTKNAKVVSPGEWLAARKELLGKEKEFTRLRDELSRASRVAMGARGEKIRIRYHQRKTESRRFI